MTNLNQARAGTTMKNKLLWNLAEHADWYGWRPRWFWLWLLRVMDRRNGYNFEYDE